MAISIKLHIPEPRGPGYWKLNNAYLKDENYCTLILDTINKCNQLKVNDTLKWDICKYEIKEASIKYAKSESRKRHNRLHKLQNELSNLYKHHTDNNTQKITEIENEITTIYNFQINGAKIRSRIQFLDEGESNSNVFLNLEKSRQTRKTLTCLKTNGKRITDMNSILSEQVHFYKSQYSSQTNDNSESYINETVIERKLTNEEAIKCDDPITYQECTSAITSMKHNKSPGLDGLTVEFYQTFRNNIHLLLISSYAESRRTELLSRTQRQCIFSLLFKKGDPENLENWRPISLLNIDYKILAKVHKDYRLFYRH